MSTRLTEERVKEIFKDCQLRPDKIARTCTLVPGIISSVRLREEKVRQYEQEIVGLLGELPDGFRTSQGQSYIYARKDRRGRTWTTEDETVQQLLQLGMVLRKVEMTPQSEWGTEPLGMPYIVLKS